MSRDPSRAISFAIVGACMTAFAEARAAGAGAFVDASIGRGWNGGVVDTDDTQWRIGAGYRWAVTPSIALGVEAGYADLGTVMHGTAIIVDPAGGGSVPFDVDAHGPTLGLDARFDVAPAWFVSGRLGVQRVNLGAGAYGAHIVRDHDDAWYAGVGVGHDVTDAFSVGLRYDRIRFDLGPEDVDADQLGVFGEYRY